ncbi:PREDICTED: uncharacterized protein LOC104613500 [Nelumbo nucifera]|uniref:DUF538 domain-containing protein n=2 Tax=Nelumbo nucifera TaxID=4432 RepID=A0A822Z7T3_NELNU|nr:PREDICTED: uncharacterized protein LOC104613500 [Nelumbo nucifera]DAD37548.1 TPA_asm: hypothetical protein HUJ06_008189 [Nelumbo nucifera]
MASQAIANYREKAEIYHGDSLCKEKSLQLLEEISLPKGLLPLDGMEEVGYNREAGFVWLKQRKGTQHTFKRIGKQVSYANEITAFVENHRMKKLTGVKSKELLIWVTLSDIYIDDPASGKISFKTPAGISRSFPVSAFELEEEANKKEESAKN